MCNPQGRRGPDRERGKHGDDARLHAFGASPGSAFVARRAALLALAIRRGGCAAATDLAAIAALAASRFCAGREPSVPIRAALIASTPGVRDLRLSTKRFAGSAAAGAVGGRLSLHPPGAATIALIIYVGGSILALIGGFRGLRIIEALSLIAVPFLFNLMLAIAPTGTWPNWRRATAHANCPFQRRS